MSLTELTDEELMARLDALCARNTKLMVQLLLHLGEVDARGLFRDDGHTSMFVYCKDRLRMCESAIWRRLHAARLCRRAPRLVELLEAGKVHLSGLAMIEPRVSDERLEVLIDEVAGKSKRQIEKMLVTASPKPDVPTSLRKLPDRATSRSGGDASGVGDSTTADLSMATMVGASIEGLKLPTPPSRRARTEPLSETTHKLQLTMSEEPRAKLERAAELMSHSNPSGDLAVVFERAVDALLEKLEKARFGSRAQKRTKKSGPVTAGYVSREKTGKVFERDGHQCTYVSEGGKRCEARKLLQIDHIEPRGLGGGDEIENLRTRCRPHNQLYAEQVYGAEHVARRIRERRRGGSG